jgi:hypothetical protein
LKPKIENSCNNHPYIQNRFSFKFPFFTSLQGRSISLPIYKVSEWHFKFFKCLKLNYVWQTLESPMTFMDY